MGFELLFYLENFRSEGDLAMVSSPYWARLSRVHFAGSEAEGGVKAWGLTL